LQRLTVAVAGQAHGHFIEGALKEPEIPTLLSGTIIDCVFRAGRAANYSLTRVRVPEAVAPQRAPCNPFLSVYVVGNVAVSRYDSRKTEDKPMAWTTPVLVEICIGLEINGYLPAEF
jgi:coenzyme PQQ precursor peptide PqqA